MAIDRRVLGRTGRATPKKKVAKKKVSKKKVVKKSPSKFKDTMSRSVLTGKKVPSTRSNPTPTAASIRKRRSKK